MQLEKTKQIENQAIVVRERETVLFIINPNSGAGNPKNLSGKIEKSIDSSRFVASIVFSQNPGDSYNLAKAYLERGIKKIFAVGGDGTVNDVARALVNTDAILGVIPIGSGNGFARHLRIPINVTQAVRIMNRERIAMIDFGLINHIPFFCTAGVGFDAHVGNKFAELQKRGFSSYIKTTIKEFFKYEPQLYTLRDNGHAIEKEAFSITVANASQFGNNAYIAPNADITDGMLDVTIISPFPKFLSPAFGIKLFNRKLGRSKYVEMFRIRQLTVERSNPGFVHFDGEPLTMDKCLAFKVQPLGLKVFIP